MKCKVCPLECKDDKWSRIRAHEAGWFEQKNGDVYCPEHKPAWVAKWREQKEGR